MRGFFTNVYKKQKAREMKKPDIKDYPPRNPHDLEWTGCDPQYLKDMAKWEEENKPKPKTAMRVLLDCLDGLPFAGSQDHSYLVNIIQQDLLYREKEQIMDAWKERDRFYRHESAADYYNKTYNQ